MTTSPYLEGNFAPVEEELTAHDLEVRGELPRELNGRLLRPAMVVVAAEPSADGETDTG